jgi:hypothetical protein
MPRGARTLGVGGVLWDRFPDVVSLGGSPLNFAIQLNRLRRDALVVSAVAEVAAFSNHAGASVASVAGAIPDR